MILVLYGSYRSDRQGIHLARYLVERLVKQGMASELIDAKEFDLPILDRMYKEYESGQAPAALEKLAGKIRWADGFVFVAGEYNWSVQPGLKNLTDYFLEEWFWRPAAIASYSAGRIAGARSSLAWRSILGEMGMIVISSSLTIGPISETFDGNGDVMGEGGAALEHAFPCFAADFAWWIEAAQRQKAYRLPPF